MHETIEGCGQLENWESPEKRIPVSYRFDITTDLVDSPGLPRVAARRHSIGKINSLTGEPLTAGYHRLLASDGEILKVKNVGLAHWVILAS